MRPLSALDEHLHQELKSIEERGLLRSLVPFSDVSATHVVIHGRRMILCASNNYLGLAQDPRVIAAGAKAASEYGSGSTGSRLITGHTLLHHTFEEELARFKGTEAALVFSSGYMANLAVLSTLAGADDIIFSDALNHASIVDGCRLSKAKVMIYRHSDMQDLDSLLQTPCKGRRFVVTDGVFSMDGDLALLPEIVALAKRYGAFVIVDDAHGTGVIGAKGAGTADYYGIPADSIAVNMGTLSKAFGAEGGYIAGSSTLIQYLINRGRPFIFNTGLAPAMVGAAMESLRAIQMEPELRNGLSQKVQWFRAQLRDLGLGVAEGITPIIPVVIGSAEASVRFAASLREAGVFAPAIRPPTVPDGTARIRVTLTAAHEMDDLKHIVSAFALAMEGENMR